MQVYQLFMLVIIYLISSVTNLARWLNWIVVWNAHAYLVREALSVLRKFFFYGFDVVYKVSYLLVFFIQSLLNFLKVKYALAVRLICHHLAFSFIWRWSHCNRTVSNVKGRPRRKLLNRRHVRHLVLFLVSLHWHYPVMFSLLSLNGVSLIILWVLSNVLCQVCYWFVLRFCVYPFAENGVVVNTLVLSSCFSRLIAYRSMCCLSLSYKYLIYVVFTILEVSEPHDHHLTFHLELFHQLDVVFSSAVLYFVVYLLLYVVSLQLHVHDHF